jgi:hypothetical protein
MFELCRTEVCAPPLPDRFGSDPSNRSPFPARNNLCVGFDVVQQQYTLLQNYYLYRQEQMSARGGSSIISYAEHLAGHFLLVLVR